MDMRKIAMIGLTAATTFVWTPAMAQDAPIEFRMAPSTRNPAPCMRLDSSMSRVHTLTMMGDHAIIKSAGGIDDRLRQTAPKVYETTLQLQQVQLKVVANAATTPRTLTVTDANTGCRWDATTP